MSLSIQDSRCGCHKNSGRGSLGKERPRGKRAGTVDRDNAAGREPASRCFSSVNRKRGRGWDHQEAKQGTAWHQSRGFQSETGKRGEGAGETAPKKTVGAALGAHDWVIKWGPRKGPGPLKAKGFEGIGRWEGGGKEK